MDGIQEGGVCTQKVSLFALIGAVAIAAAFGFIVISDDASAVSYDLSGDDFAEVDSSVTYTLAYDVDADTKYTSKLIDANGNEMYIEVKTTTQGENASFYISANELEKSKQYANKYYLYRVYQFDMKTAQGQYSVRKGSLEDLCLVAQTYRVDFKGITDEQ